MSPKKNAIARRDGSMSATSGPKTGSAGTKKRDRLRNASVNVNATMNVNVTIVKYHGVGW